MDVNTVLIWLALGFGFYMAWNIGANDVANAMGTSVGSGALTLKRAVIAAAILEFCGAFFVGMHVTDTVRKGIIDPTIFEGHELEFMLGMLASLLAAGAWLQLASYFGWPVSTTHSIVGAIVGFGSVYGGLEAVQWGKIGFVVASWVVSPLLAGSISYIIFRLLLKSIFYSTDPVRSAKKLTPVLVFFVFVILTFVLVFKGLKNLKLDLSFGNASLIACGVGLLAAFVGYLLVQRVKEGPEQASAPVGQFHEHSIDRGLRKARKHLQRVKNATEGDMRNRVNEMLTEIEIIATQVPKTQASEEETDQRLVTVEKIFVYLQILSACFVAFAHGANDVANAIGPVAAVVNTAREGVIATQAHVSIWILAIGGIGIVLGLATWGWRVIETIGRRITELTPTRGFAAEFGAATTIVIASKFGLPISTTHTLVGAVLGVGLARGLGALNLNTVRDIAISWVVTLPAGAGLAIVFFYCLKLAF